MDPKMIEMNRLNDYLHQTIELLTRGQRMGNGVGGPIGYSPFGPVPTVGTDVVWAQQSPWGFSGSPIPGTLPYSPFGVSSFTGSFDPFYAQRAFSPTPYGAYPQAWGQQSWNPQWSPISQAHLTQTLLARQQVLEAACRACGIPV